MAKTMCPITQKRCYMHDQINNSENEDAWIECVFEDDDNTGCLVKQALEAHIEMAERFTENFWKNGYMNSSAFGVFHVNSAID